MCYEGACYLPWVCVEAPDSVPLTLSPASALCKVGLNCHGCYVNVDNDFWLSMPNLFHLPFGSLGQFIASSRTWDIRGNVKVSYIIKAIVGG
jgi:hypothetical protein